MLTRATSDESEPTPGYMLPEINSIFHSLTFSRSQILDLFVQGFQHIFCVTVHAV